MCFVCGYVFVWVVFWFDECCFVDEYVGVLCEFFECW